jgi:outer membrane receptor protein involved in Fe transport
MDHRKNITSLTVAVIAAVPAAFLLPQSGWAEVEEIVVTTRRREENLQEVPIAVTSIDAQKIERAGIRNMFDIAQLDPSVSMDVAFAPSDTKIAIRGLSNTRGRSNAAFLIDGIDVTTENLGLPGSGMLANMRLLGDVERIEIVKGPQSALFGRSAFAGALSYTTKNPTDEFEAKLGVDLAEHQRQQVNGSVSGPINDTLGYRLDGVWWTSDGYYSNSIPGGGNVGGGKGAGISGTLLWEPDDAVSVKARVSYSDDEYDPRPQIRVPATVLALYPQSGIDAGLADTGFWLFRKECGEDENGNPIWCEPIDELDMTGTRAVGLKNHGRYCPDNPALDDRDNTSSPGFCNVTNIGSAKDPRTGETYKVTHSEDWRTGEDYPGNTQDVLRATVIADWDQSYGTFSSYTGLTDSNESDLSDLDYEAFQRPDILLSQWEANTEHETDQFSQEFRFSSNYDGALNFTAGALYWHEKRKMNDANVIIACLPIARDRSAFEQNGAQDVQVDPEAGPLVMTPGICDGNNGGLWPGGQSVGGANTDFLVWQPYMRQINNPGTLTDGSARQGPGVPWKAETNHLSFYGMVEWQMSDAWKVTVEARYVDESFKLRKPNKTSCDELGFAAASGSTDSDPSTSVPFFPLLDENNVAPANYLNLCSYEDEWDRDNVPLSDGTPNPNRWQMIEGKVKSSFVTPKITVEWTPTESSMLYFSYARAQKPGGINALVTGGSATTLSAERFDAEKMAAWEIGGKTDWEAAGYLRMNFAAFFQDYTDKQVGTQVIVNDILSPRVTNASSAEVKGVELDVLWQPDAVDGLTLTAAYTWLDPTFSKYIDDTKSLIRASHYGDCPIVYTGREGADPDDVTKNDNGGPKCRLDLSGNDLELTARNAFVAAINVVRPLGDTGLDWVVDFNTSFQDKRFENQDSYRYLDEYWLSNLRLGLSSESWDLLFYVDNVFDDDTLKTSSSAPDFGKQVTQLGFLAGLGTSNLTATLPDPRVYGLRMNYRFGAK